MTKKVRLWKLGNSEHSILPTPRAIEALKNILEEAKESEEEVLDIIWDTDIEVKMIQMDDNDVEDYIVGIDGRLEKI